MITRNQICKAIKTLRGEVYPDPTGLLRQLAGSLQVYRRREEWDGSVDSAIECLRLAAYEISDVPEQPTAIRVHQLSKAEQQDLFATEGMPLFEMT